MKNAIIYTRVSTDEQREKGYSLPDQREKLVKYCQDKGYIIVKHFVDDCSGRNFERPEFKKLFDFIVKNKGLIQSLIVVKYDRFSRDMQQGMAMKAALKKLGIDFIAIEQPLDDSIPENLIMEAIYMAIPEVENKRRGLNTLTGMRRAMKEGRWVSGAPLGYSMGRDTLNKPLLIKNEKAPLIKEAFELYSMGLYDREEIRRKLNLKGLKCQKNNFWKLLHNPVYCGKIRIKEYKDEPEEIVKGLHEPIISEVLFSRVQQVAKSKRLAKAKTKKRSDKLPMRGYLICNECGGNLTGSASKGKCGGKYYYYHCQNGCKERYRADFAYNSLLEWLQNISLKPEIATLYMAIIQDVFKTQLGNTDFEINRLIKERQNCLEQIDKTAKKFVNGDLDPVTYNRLKKGYDDETSKYTSQIDELKNTDKNILHYAEYSFILLSNLSRAFQVTSVEGKQKMLGSIFPDKLIFDGKNYRTPQQNELLSLLFNNNKGFEGTIMKLVSKNTDQFPVVARRGIEPLFPG